MQPTTAASAFSFGGLSAPSTTNIFKGTSTSKSQPFSFSSSKTPSLFGNPPATSIAAPKPGSLFSFQPTQQNQPILGQQTTSAFGNFVASSVNFPLFKYHFIFAAVPHNVASIIAYGLQNNSILQQQQQQLQQQQNSVNAFYASLSQPLLFGDERDNIITRLNQLQAMLGTGTGYSALGAVAYTMENPFSRFRGIAYNVLPASTEADGLVCLEVNLPTATVLSQKQGLQDHLFRLLGGRPNFQLIIEEIRPSARSETNTEVVIKVVERQASGSLHTIPASDLANYLCSPTVKQELQSQLCVILLTPELAPSTSQLNVYLETPPAGLDRLVWQQARADNPAPDRLIPVPVVGFADLKRRRADQLLFADQQRKSVKVCPRILTLTTIATTFI
ncbi:unnamed protein product [Dibothriocephalus latus]|uniref:Nucleoporin Nup54 alpha-helical domain-containing protein n=1 Tax=Dibothriocephalus latus TaxID=60516 RepID=A0A3P7QZD0_DIBLA|nr:unnamed protein product [Dibothriocephalus latus]